MCGRFYRAVDGPTVARSFDAEISDEPWSCAPGYNIAPTTTQPVVREVRKSGMREIVPMRWGLVGAYSSGPDPKRSTFNARSETVEKSPLWRRPFFRQRCLVPVSGFFEWRKPEKTAFRFSVKGMEVFGLAGLWDLWQDASKGQWLQSFSILTTEANELMREVHDRMPVIVAPQHYAVWLDRTGQEHPPAFLLRPFDADRMERFPAHPQVGNVRNQGKEMLNSV